MQRGLPNERDVRKVSMNLRTRVGRKGWRRTLSVVTPEVAMMIDTSLNVEDDSLVAGIVSFLLSFFPSTSLVGSLFTVNDGGRCNEVGVVQRSGENECTFLSSVRGAGVTQCRDAPYRKRRWYGTVKGLSDVDYLSEVVSYGIRDMHEGGGTR